MCVFLCIAPIFQKSHKSFGEPPLAPKGILGKSYCTLIAPRFLLTGPVKKTHLATTSRSVPLFEQSDPEGQTMSNTGAHKPRAYFASLLSGAHHRAASGGTEMCSCTITRLP